MKTLIEMARGFNLVEFHLIKNEVGLRVAIRARSGK